MARIYPWNETAQKHYVSIKNILDKDPISPHTHIANEIGVSKQRVGQIIATINREAVLNRDIEPIVVIRPPRPNKGRPRKRNPGFQGGSCTKCGKFLAWSKGNKKVYEKVGGINGCTHMVEMLFPIATTSFQTIYSYKNKNIKKK